MKKEMIQLPKKEYEELLEEIGILKNQKMMEAIIDNNKANKRGIKTWKLNF